MPNAPVQVPETYVTSERAAQEMATYDDLMRPKVPPELMPVYVECYLEEEGHYFTAELQPKRIFLRTSCPKCRTEYPDGTMWCAADNYKLGRTAPIKGSERVYTLSWDWQRSKYPPEFIEPWMRVRPFDQQETVEFKKWKHATDTDLKRRFVGKRLPDSVRVSNPTVEAKASPPAKK